MADILSALWGAVVYVEYNITPTIIFYAVLLFFLVRFIRKLDTVVKDNDNDLDWSQFISTPGKDGKAYADITKLGQAVGIIMVFFILITLSHKITDLTWVGFSAILTLGLTYLAGVQMFFAYMKSKSAKPREEEQKDTP